MSAGARIIGITLAVAVIALPVVAVVKGWVGAERFPLDKLRITSEFRHIDGSELQKVLTPYAAQGFFAVRLADAQRAVETLPWVDQAEVSKKWPDVLEVRIVEHRPFALWDEEMLLSDHGKLYPRTVMGDALPPGLPQLGGNPRQIEAVVRQYNEAKQAFAAAGLDVQGLRQDARGSWSLQLSSGTEVVVGRSDAEARIRRFARLLPQLIPPPGKTLARADLRYANGFALKWNQEQGSEVRGQGPVVQGPVVQGPVTAIATAKTATTTTVLSLQSSFHSAQSLAPEHWPLAPKT